MEGHWDDDRHIVHAEWGRRWSGGVNQVFLLVRGLLARGVSSTLVCPADAPLAGRAAAAGIPVTPFPLRGEHDLPTWWRFAKWLRAQRHWAPLLVHVHSRRGALPTALIAKGLKAQTVLHWRVAAPLPRWLARLADAVIAVSAASADAARQAGVPAERVAVVRSAIEAERFAPPPGARRHARARWGLSEDAFVVAGVGRLVAGKGYEVVLSALAQMGERERPVLLLAGDGPLRPALERAANDLRLRAWVWFLGFQDDVRTVLWAADAFVHVPTHFPEGTPNAVLEAMAAGLPVVVTPVGGTGEIVEPDRTGVLVPAGDAAALAEALRHLRADPTWRHQLGAAAQTYVRAHHNLDRLVESVCAVYERLHAEAAVAPPRGR